MSDLALFSDAMQDKAAQAADFMRLFSTPSRLMLLCHIAQRERSVGEIQDELGFKQPALSQQLAELRQAGVVRTRRESRQIYYSIADDRVAVVMEMLLAMFCGTVPVTSTEAPAGRGAGAVSLGEMARWARLDKTD
ncbi:metalloregulator ArsR/SmtB family transcription factor [Rhizobium calliandrae]|uniref:Metalloregulator ArsR/SmtB family transcription factor n=1 Tax=Rhizobium calliandrae TaxID=1312182 RepID=A0ABT7KBA4_9HYPH|nr:metalloregulator ArsR/SmtB family transcription factor [Rhizobium calliandrae]MDL2405899.1 metalloregulator ArsR/SmtB family transcription factor [Rhizobium calliandrae]